MVVIRLARGGAKGRPFYQIVAADKRKPLSGRFIEKIGYFNPFATGGEKRIVLNIERMDYWQGQGAQLSERFQVILKEYQHGPKPKKAKKKSKTVAAKTEEAKPEARANTETAPKAEEEIQKSSE